jgi:hypothetical protein
MKRVVLTAALLAFALTGIGCSKNESAKEEAAKPAASAAASASAAVASAVAALSASAAPPAMAQAESLPGPDKADRKARRQITSANYKAELDKLDKEIGNP